MTDPISSGNRASHILDSEEWKDAWEAYRTRIMELIDEAPSDAVDKVMHLKRLLAAATGARAHLERLIGEGKVAAKELEFEETKRKRSIFSITR